MATVAAAATDAAAPHGVEVYVNYRRRADSTFDYDYYVRSHIPLMARTWGPGGLQAWTVVQYGEGDALGLHATARLTFASFAVAERVMANMTPELLADRKNYSNYAPEVSRATVLARAEL